MKFDGPSARGAFANILRTRSIRAAAFPRQRIGQIREAEMALSLRGVKCHPPLSRARLGVTGKASATGFLQIQDGEGKGVEKPRENAPREKVADAQSRALRRRQDRIPRTRMPHDRRGPTILRRNDRRACGRGYESGQFETFAIMLKMAA